MVRIIVQIVDAGAAANVGGPVIQSYRTFDIEHPEMEKALTHDSNSYVQRSCIGAEVIKEPDSR